MRRGLSAVAERQRADILRNGGDLVHRIDGTERVRDVSERDHLGLARDERAQLFQIHFTRGRQLTDAELGAHRRSELLPGNEVGVMLHARHHHPVASPNVRTTPGRGEEVHRFGGAAREDQRIGVGRSQESRDAVARALVGFGRRGRQRVGSTVRVGVVALVVGDHRVEHRARLLRGGRRVKVVQRRIRREQRKIRARRQRANSAG